jgi:hypothetical protein
MRRERIKGQYGLSLHVRWLRFCKLWGLFNSNERKHGMNVGDVNSQEKGSGARYNAGKADFSLIPLCTLEDEAKVWEYGKRKYAAWNWAKGMPWSVPFACAMRHLSAWQQGEEIDEESGLPHLAHAMCNLRMLVLFSETYREGDDRPPRQWMPDDKPW